MHDKSANLAWHVGSMLPAQLWLSADELSAAKD
jgi:hypothetical protein